MKITRILLTLAASVALVFGTLAPATAAETWWCDCDTTGMAQCSGPDIADAWESFDAKTPAIRYSHRNPLTYMRTYHKYPMVGKQSVVVKSVNIKHTWHVFTYRHKP